VVQGWNNCGPANVSMALSYFSLDIKQNEIADFLKPHREDKNVSPWQMVAYINEKTDLKAIFRVAGTRDSLRWLVANRFMVIVETGYIPPREDWYGHYRTLVGYDDASGQFHFYDSNQESSRNPMKPQDYLSFDRDWQAFNRTYIIIYPPEREAELQTFLGREWSVSANWRTAADIALQESAANPENGFAWFNYGVALTRLGDYATAASAFDIARTKQLPWRMLWYQFEIYEAYFQMGRLDDVMALAEASLKTTAYVEETYYYIGRVYEVRGDIDAAIDQYQIALEFNENFQLAREALIRLGQQP
jgi:tetratricopeptide (TPR) repeat protein